MTPDEEVISDYEQDLRDVREGIREAAFLLGSIAVLVFGAWMFAR